MAKKMLSVHLQRCHYCTIPPTTIKPQEIHNVPGFERNVQQLETKFRLYSDSLIHLKGVSISTNPVHMLD